MTRNLKIEMISKINFHDFLKNSFDIQSFRSISKKFLFLQIMRSMPQPVLWLDSAVIHTSTLKPFFRSVYNINTAYSVTFDDIFFMIFINTFVEVVRHIISIFWKRVPVKELPISDHAFFK